MPKGGLKLLNKLSMQGVDGVKTTFRAGINE
jgi:hypothetical protein